MNNIDLIELDNNSAYTKGNAIRNSTDMPKPLVTKRMDNEWLHRLSDKFWATNYSGILHREYPGHLIPYLKIALRLRDKILTFGGEQVCMPFLESDMPLVLDRGQLWYGDRVIVNLGRSRQAHYNASVIWKNKRKNKDELVRIATGYALSDDGMWRSHTWCVLVEEESNTIIETTEERLAYFGFVLSETEAAAFYNQQT